MNNAGLKELLLILDSRVLNKTIHLILKAVSPVAPAPHLGHVTMATAGQLKGAGLLLFLSMLLLLFSFHQSELLI